MKKKNHPIRIIIAYHYSTIGAHTAHIRMHIIPGCIVYAQSSFSPYLQTTMCDGNK